MTGDQYLKMLVEDMHSAIIATIGTDGHPQTRVIEEGSIFSQQREKPFMHSLWSRSSQLFLLLRIKNP